MDLNRITGDLKLAFPIRWAEKSSGDEGKRPLFEPLIWAYHTPISTEVFEANYRIIAATNRTIFAEGMSYAGQTGPLIATLSLRDAARADAIKNELEIEGDPATPLLAEIKRLTMIVAPSPQGYNALPVEIALRDRAIDAEDWKEAESSIVFFTCGLWMSRREFRTMYRNGLASALRGSMTSLPPTEFVAGLVTSTKPEISERPEPSLVPS